MQVRCLPSILIATSPVGRVVILPSASSTAIESSMATCRLSSVLVGRHVCSDPVSTIVSISRKSPPSLFPTRIVATISPMESPLLVPPARQSPRVHRCPIISPPEGPSPHGWPDFPSPLPSPQGEGEGTICRRPAGLGSFQVLNLLFEAFGLANPDSKRHGVAGGAEARAAWATVGEAAMMERADGWRKVRPEFSISLSFPPIRAYWTGWRVGSVCL